MGKIQRETSMMLHKKAPYSVLNGDPFIDGPHVMNKFMLIFLNYGTLLIYLMKSFLKASYSVLMGLPSVTLLRVLAVCAI